MNCRLLIAVLVGLAPQVGAKMEKQFKYCCTSFADKSAALQELAGGGFMYPIGRRPIEQFEPDDDSDTWNINGCCGGGCFVVTEMKFCPYCGERLTNPFLPNEHTT